MRDKRFNNIQMLKDNLKRHHTYTMGLDEWLQKSQDAMKMQYYDQIRMAGIMEERDELGNRLN